MADADTLVICPRCGGTWSACMLCGAQQLVPAWAAVEYALRNTHLGEGVIVAPQVGDKVAVWRKAQRGETD